MKKTRNNKYGFTLLEMIAVVAIIVVISAALTLGYTAYINNSKAKSEQVKAHSNAYVGAIGDVNSTLKVTSSDQLKGWVGMVEEVDEPVVNAGGGAATPTTPPAPTTAPEPTTAPTSTPEPTPVPPTTTPEPTPEPTTVPTPTTTPPAPGGTTPPAPAGNGSKPANISNLPGSVNAGNASQVNCSQGSVMNWGDDAVNVSTSYKESIYSITVKVEGNGTSITNVDWRYEVTSQGNGVYKITYKANDQYNQPISNLNFVYKASHGTAGKVTVQGVEYYK